jgi:hypothetical protein
VVFIPNSTRLASLSNDVLLTLIGPEIGLTIYSPIAPTYLAHYGRDLCLPPITPLGFHQTETISRRPLGAQRAFTVHADWFRGIDNLPLRIFGVPISLDLYALHDARCITSRLTRSIGLEFECPHTHIHALSYNSLSGILATTRIPSRLTFDETVLCLHVSTAKSI